MACTMNRRKSEVTGRPHQSSRILAPIHKPTPQLRIPVIFRAFPFHVQRPLIVTDPITYEVVISCVDQNSNALMQQFGDVKLILMEKVTGEVEGHSYLI